MSDKAIYSVDTVETITDNDKIYVNTGDNIKQIKRSDLFIDINSNLDALSYGENSGSQNLWNEDYSQLDGTSIIYVPLNVGDGTFTLSSKIPSDDGGSADIFFFAGSVTSGASTSLNGVWDGRPITVTSLNGYVTVAYRKQALSPTDYKTMLNSGSIALPYEPYIPSVKMIAEEVSAQNESLCDYNLNNKCNSLYQGYANWWDGNIEEGVNYIHTDYISVNDGDLVTIKAFKNASHVIYYNSSKQFVSFKADINKVTVPSGVSYIVLNFNEIGITPQNAGHVGVYVDNEIDQLKNDFVALPTFIKIPYADTSNEITITVPNGGETRKLVYLFTTQGMYSMYYVSLRDEAQLITSDENTTVSIRSGKLTITRNNILYYSSALAIVV